MSDSKEYLAKVVGDKPLCCIRSPKNHMHLRVFVADDENNQVVEVTQSIASLLKSRTTRNGDYITYRGGGYSPVQQLASQYGMAMGEDGTHAYTDLH